MKRTWLTSLPRAPLLDRAGRLEVSLAGKIFASLVWLLIVGSASGQTAPSIDSPPHNITVGAGGIANFAVTASGDAPLLYQWRLNNVDIASATNSVLTLTNAQLAWSGSGYSVVVTNASGSITSPVATLTVMGTAVTSANLNSTWRATNSPYVVDTNQIITNASIESGVTVLFTGPYQLEITGSFSTTGTSNNPIQFTAEPGASNWNGIYFNAATGALEMSWCVVERSTNSGIRIHSCSPLLRHCTIRDNSAARGGGINTDSSLTLEDCDIVSNRVSVTSASVVDGGGGIYASGGRLTLRSTRVRENMMLGCCANDVRGGGIYSLGETVIEDSAITQNRIDQSGGAEHGAGVCAEGTLKCYRSTISSNEVLCANNGGMGGGVAAFGSAIFSQCNFQGNRQRAAEQSWGGAVFSASSLWMTNCIITDNSATSCGPWGSWLWGSAIYGNSGVIENCTITHNSLAGTSFPEQGAIQFDGIIRNTIVYFNSHTQIGPFSSVPTVAYCDVQGGFAGSGNAAADPLFADTVSYLLASNSPCIDAGDPNRSDNDSFFPPSLGTERNDMGAWGGPRAGFGGYGGALGILVNGKEDMAFTFTETNSAVITLQAPFPSAHVFYALDGTPPATNAPQYTQAFAITNTAAVARTFLIRATAYDSNYSQSVSSGPILVTFVPRTVHVAQQGQGTVTVSPALPTYAIGQLVMLSAAPTRWFQFVRWLDGVTTSNRAVTINSSNNYYVAIFTNTVPLEELLFEQWQRSWGGTSADYLRNVVATHDGGLLLVGDSSSAIGGNKTVAPLGDRDWWLIKTDAAGNEQWQKAYGTASQDTLFAARETADGGFVLAGELGAVGAVMKISAEGNQQWLGTNGNNPLRAIQETADGTFLAAGLIDNGTSDFSLVKFDVTGRLEWAHAIGGSNQQDALFLEPAIDGGYLVGGLDGSPIDGRVVKLDAQGNEITSATFGGSGSDFFRAALPLPDGQFLVAGNSSSLPGTGNKSSTNHGGSDYWLVGLDRSATNKLFEQTFGGSLAEEARALCADGLGGFLLAGFSESPTSGNKATGNFGGYDWWLVRLDSVGNRIGEYIWGGSGDDVLMTMTRTSDGYVLAGYSESTNSGTKTSGRLGAEDWWVMKLLARVAPIGTPAVLVDGQYSPTNGFRFTETNAAQISLSTTFTNGIIRYTLDGSTPTLSSPLYTGSFGITNATTFNRTFAIQAVAWNSNLTASATSDVVVVTFVPRRLTLAQQGRGTVTVFPAQTSYAIGQQVLLTANPGRWYQFVRWTDGNTNDLRAITVTASNNFYSAVFTNTVPLEELMFKEWDRAYGGEELEHGTAIVRANDGGCFVGGSSHSGVSGTKTSPNYGNHDYWLLRLDATGNKMWDRSFGGTGEEFAASVTLTPDGGCLIAGVSSSGINGNKTSPNYGSYDFWLVRVDADGNKLWENSFGGNTSEGMECNVALTADGGFIVGGFSASGISGNKTSPGYGSDDFWVIKVDADGNKIWENTFGGSGGEILYAILALPEGGYLLGGHSTSGVSGNKTSASYGSSDFWLVRLDANGNKLWEKSYGGSQDDRIYGMAAAPDGGFLLGGSSWSGISGTKTSPNYGSSYADYWIVKIDSSGNAIWDKSFGGDNHDVLYRVVPRDDGTFLLGGVSLSGITGTKTSPNRSNPFTDYDYWTIQIDSSGNQRWEETFGGTLHDYFYDARLIDDNGYVLIGRSSSGVDGNKTAPNYGDGDFWVVQLATREAPVGMPAVLVNGLFAANNHHPITFTNAAQVALTSSVPGAHIFFTLDGTDPDFGSTEYSGPFTVANSLEIHALTADVNYFPLGDVVTNFVDFIPAYALTDATPGGGTVLFNPPNGPYLSNSVVTASAMPFPGWTFAGWSGDATGTNNPLAIPMTANKTVKAVFVTGLFSSPVPPTLGAVLTYPPASNHAFGTNVTLSAVPNNGRYFVRWSNTNYGSITPLTISVTNANLTNNALFGTLSGDTRSLTLLVNGPGSVNKSPESAFYTNSAGIIVFATPDSGFIFTGWSGDATGTNNPLGVTLTTNKIITANFGTVAPPSNPPPVVTITNPVDGAVFIAPASITISASASDTNGTIAQVVFFAGTNQLALFTNAPYTYVWTNAPLGTNVLTAVATDNGGAAATSAPVAVTVTLPPPGPPVFSLGNATYFVLENGGSVTVTVLKSLNSLAGTVNFASLDGSAVAVAGGVGDFYPVSGSLTFASNETSKAVTILVVDDQSYEGNQQFTFALSLSGTNGSLANPSSATITVVENDSPASTNSLLEVLFPGAVPPHDGQLRVSIQPTNSGGQWRLAWETAWRNSGDVISGLPSGNYEVEFRPVNGYLAPNNTTNPVIAGQLTSATNQYVVSGTPQFGALAVTLLPAALAAEINPALRAQWRLQGESLWHDSGFQHTNLPTGDHIVEFKSVVDWVAPAPRVVLVGSDQLNSISATYLVADGSSGTPPSVLQFSDATTPLNHQPPYPWTGQLLSDSGYGSGVVAKRRVVLTAAHVVFDDSTLSYVTRVRWFFQRHKGEFEPPAQTPRGWYAFSGYAAARTNDNSPGVSSPTSQNLDVAALYFLEDAGRGGQSGYLVSEPGGTEWLQASALKTLVGYPVEVVNEINRGRMHATLPGNLSFAHVTNRVFSTAAIRGYPGMSGGPLCVEAADGTYYPAAIYLGGSAQTIVRAIDGAVADLINRADVSANTGDNNTGGGVVLLTPGAGTLFASGYFQVAINPPEALTAGAGWRVTQLTNLSFFNDNSATYALPPANYTLTFKPAFGFLTPPNRLLQVIANQTTVIPITYTNLSPRGFPPSVSNGIPQVVFTAPTGQRYVIERSANLLNWTPLVTNIVAADGTLRFSDASLLESAFYRARLVP